MYIRSPFAGEYHMDGFKLNKSRDQRPMMMCAHLLTCDLHDI